jgi:hypothetical protein
VASLAAQTHTLCVFDYDLTLSSNKCPLTEGNVGYHCLQTDCITYNWHDQCLAAGARDVIAECVRREAFIGIASKADVDACWQGKIKPVVDDNQLPELTGSAYYDRPDSSFSYPAIDDRGNWNCADCAYNMDATLSKPDGIGRVMRHYGMDPAHAADRGRVIFWDDSPENITAVRNAMPEVNAILVPRNGASGDDGGCGITSDEIRLAWPDYTDTAPTSITRCSVSSPLRISGAPGGIQVVPPAGARSVRVELFELSGKRVQVTEFRADGPRTIATAGTAGVYLVRVQSGNLTTVRRCLLR